VTGINWLEAITAFLTVNLNLALWAIFISSIIRKKADRKHPHEKYLVNQLIKKCGSSNQKLPKPPPTYHSQQLCLFNQMQKSKLKGEFGYVSNIINRV